MAVYPWLLGVAAIAAAYLIGAIPFGFLIARWVGGIDIRTVGSGNIGATNVGRNLGFRFFVLVFALDLAKGFVPTWGFPRLFATLAGASAPDLPVLVALATILGHNFPVYLKFKGGKGVATSLGAVLALDWVAALSSAAGFTAALVASRYVSLSSLLGASVFVIVHFVRVGAPWSREELAMSVATVGLFVMLLVRHRKNLARIAAGTEPKVALRKRRDDRPDAPPHGRIAVAWLVILAVVVLLGAGATALWQRATRTQVLTIGCLELSEVARAATSYQRAERVAFADGGRLLAVTCPRYNRLVLYRVSDRDALELEGDLELEGKPVAVCAATDRLYVLERPPGDERHVQPGWWETFDFRGQRLGERVRVGYYPDDMALSADGRHAFVLTSGRAEGDANKPAPALDVYTLESAGKPIGRVTFDGSDDDPCRLTLSSSGQCVVVTLSGSNMSAAVDLADPREPCMIGRARLASADAPYASRSESDDDWIIMPSASGREAVALKCGSLGDCVAVTLPRDSAIELHQVSPRRALGKLRLRGGATGLGMTRPTGLAYSHERNLLAVANRSGGVHLVAIRARQKAVAAGTSAGNTLRGN
jgi:glycerol-3-phosphate acyltransferase PlsY